MKREWSYNSFVFFVPFVVKKNCVEFMNAAIKVENLGSPYKTMQVNNFNKLHIIAFATFVRKWDFSPAKTLCPGGAKAPLPIVTYHGCFIRNGIS